jgi:hypothetical protein
VQYTNATIIEEVNASQRGMFKPCYQLGFRNTTDGLANTLGRIFQEPGYQWADGRGLFGMITTVLPPNTQLSNDIVATDTLVITREGTERVVDFAFQLAKKRNGRPSDGKRKVTCVDKANVFRSFAFFRKVFMDVAEQYPEIESDTMYVDAMSQLMVTTPSQWDVLIMENQFGYILSDLGAAIVGGLGLAPPAEIGNDHALSQPSHGTAPQLAGKNFASPLATILSVAMMFDWLADRHAGRVKNQQPKQTARKTMNKTLLPKRFVAVLAIVWIGFLTTNFTAKAADANRLEVKASRSILEGSDFYLDKGK